MLPKLTHGAAGETDVFHENRRNMSTGLQLITKNNLGTTTWPLKVEKRKAGKRAPRPRTATLEYPTLLDIAFLQKVDMSLVRKELLHISNLCRPVGRKFDTKRKGTSVYDESIVKSRRQSSTNAKYVHNRSPSSRDSAAAGGRSLHRLRLPTTTENCWEIVKNGSAAKAPHKHGLPKKIDTVHPPDSDSSCISPKYRTDNNFHRTPLNRPTSKIPTFNKSDADGDSRSPKPTKLNPRLVLNKVETKKTPREVFSVPHLKQTIPEPCRACGRNDQPERFHSHAAAVPHPHLHPSKSISMEPAKTRKPKPVKPVGWSAAKSVASASESQNSAREAEKAPKSAAKAKTRPTKKLGGDAEVSQVPRSAGQKGPKSLTCYICGREFGSASLHLHEPKCLEKWERENAQLPAHLRRTAPSKPNAQISKLEYNELAWKASQVNLNQDVYLPSRK